MKKEKSCGAVIFKKEDDQYSFLVIHQVQGHYCFPKGHVEKDETELETARREIREETGYEVSFLDGFRYSLQYSPKEGVMKDVIYFLAEENGGNPLVQQEELQGMKWMKEEDVLDHITYENDRDLYRKALAFLKEKA
ncbi:MAG: NUDIX domain-containing protein [Solobacterium sp.]|nr:NUDIX domain-containing protein [Solobacterium sp.]